MLSKLKNKYLMLVVIVVFTMIFTGCEGDKASSDIDDDQTVVSTEDISDSDLDYDEDYDEDYDDEYDDDDEDIDTDSEKEDAEAVKAADTKSKKKKEIVHGKLEIDFIDVGQADAALVICDGQTLLIDGGNRESSSLMYSYLKKREIDYLDYIIATHPDEDHIGGIAGALNYANCGTVYCSTKWHDSYVFDDFKFYVEKQGKKIEVPETGTVFHIGKAKCKIIGPVGEREDSNNNSIIVRITYGKTSFLFTGDAEFEEENDLLSSGAKLKSDVLKVAHHGSSYSTSQEFLDKVKPDYAVISVGKNNSYGHPAGVTINNLKAAGAKIYRTDRQGTITCISDGKKIEFKSEKKSGEKSSSKSKNDTDNNTALSNSSAESKDESNVYILNTNTHKFHYPKCKSVKDMKDKNKQKFQGTREECLEMGYDPCGNCHP